MPFAAHANTGVGFLILTIPVMVVGLVPVILIEAPVLSRVLKVKFLRGLWLSFLANLASTILGAIIGVAIDIPFILALGTGFPPVFWVALAALVPMFFITWWIERRVVGRMQPPDTTLLVKRATLVANAISYAALAVAVVLFYPDDPLDTRSRLTEVIAAMTATKTYSSEEFEKYGYFRTDPPPAGVSKYVRSLDRERSGRIVAVISMPSRAEIDGKRIVMEPRLEGGKIVEWKCYTPDLDFKYLPAACRQRGP